MWRAGSSGRNSGRGAAARCTKWQRCGGGVLQLPVLLHCTLHALQAYQEAGQKCDGGRAASAQQGMPRCPASPPPPPPPQLVCEGGWQALFSGLEASLIGTTVSQGIYFYL